MRFVALSPVVTLALLMAVLGLIVLAYWLKPRRRRVAVSSLALWGTVLRQHRPLVSRWRWLLSLLLACAIGAAMVLALSRPEIPALGAVSKRVVLILDNSPSMAARTRDGATRWMHTQSDAQRLLARLGSASEVMVLDTMGRAPLAGFVTPAAAWQQIGRLSVVSAGVPRMPEAGAWDVGTTSGRLQVHLFSDGVGVPDPGQEVRLHTAFEPATNLSLSAFETRPHPGDSTRVEALLQVFNASGHAAQAVVTITGPKYETSRTVDIAAGESASETIDLSHAPAGIYRAQLKAAADALGADDAAYSVLAPHAARNILLVTPGDSYLEDSLRALPDVRLTTVRPAAYQGNGRFDAYVFDRFAPKFLPPAGALLWSARAGSVEAVVTRWDAAHPVSSGVAWGDLRILHAGLAANPQDGEHALVSASAGKIEGGLITSGEAGSRWIRVGFALNQTNFHLQPGFPVFLGQALNWLDNRTQVLVRNTGSVTIPMEKAVVVDDEGRTLKSVATGPGTAFDAPRAGIYKARAAGRELLVAANFLDPAYGQINRTWLRPRAEGAAVRSNTSYIARSELWTLLLSVAALLVVIECATLCRRVSV
ncbi:MAG: BatA domain-containing protein [Burkholderiales bacterium]